MLRTPAIVLGPVFPLWLCEAETVAVQEFGGTLGIRVTCGDGARGVDGIVPAFRGHRQMLRIGRLFTGANGGSAALFAQASSRID